MDARIPNEPAAPPQAGTPPQPSGTHLVLIPSYNPGPKVFATVRDALSQWAPVWVVIDGSTDQSAQALTAMAAAQPGLRVFVLPENRGKIGRAHV